MATRIGISLQNGIVAGSYQEQVLEDVSVHIELDLKRNVLMFELERGGDQVATWTNLPGVIDIGERGRLLSLELFPDSGDAIVVPLADHADPLARSAEIVVRCGIAASGQIVTAQVPRRGPDYEITYPSGNQCWIGANGSVNCSVVSGNARPEGWRSGGEWPLRGQRRFWLPRPTP